MRPVIECRQCGQVRKRSLPAFCVPALRRKWRESRHSPSLLPSVGARAWMDFSGRAHTRVHAHVCDATVCYAAGLANDQTHPGIKFRWRIPRSDAATHTRGVKGKREREPRRRVATLRMHAYTPTLSRISMRAAPPIHAANYYRKRHNCARVQGKIGFLSTRFIHPARKAVSPGGSFFKFLSPKPSFLPPRSAISFFFNFF